MRAQDEPSRFSDCVEAAEAVVEEFMLENVASPREEEIRTELLPQVLAALEMDGHLPNDYEVLALNGSVPQDGTDPELDPEIAKDYGCPEAVARRFPNTSAVIEAQF